MLAINTDFGSYVLSICAIEDVLKKIADVGFTHVHWCHDWQTEYLYSSFEMIQIKELLKKYNLKAKGVHATEGGTRARIVNGKLNFVNRYRNLENRKDYTSPNEYTRLAGVELIKNRIDLAYIIGAKEIVLHMQLPYMELRDSEEAKNIYWKQVFRSLDELEAYSKALGVRIAFENMICTPVQDQIKQFDKLFERYDSDFLGFCFDSGHSSLMSLDDHLIFAKRYQSRIISLHIQDNDSIAPELLDDDVAVLKHDKHRAPFTGVINWSHLAKIIAKSPYELPITLEVMIPSKTATEEMEGLKASFDAGNQFSELVKNLRNKQAE
jgi:sugar phosphate isomerase/epimerase